jgi:hypothetical protein
VPCIDFPQSQHAIWPRQSLFSISFVSSFGTYNSRINYYKIPEKFSICYISDTGEDSEGVRVSGDESDSGDLGPLKISKPVINGVINPSLIERVNGMRIGERRCVPQPLLDSVPVGIQDHLKQKGLSTRFRRDARLKCVRVGGKGPDGELKLMTQIRLESQKVSDEDIHESQRGKTCDEVSGDGKSSDSGDDMVSKHVNEESIGKLVATMKSRFPEAVIMEIGGIIYDTILRQTLSSAAPPENWFETAVRDAEWEVQMYRSFRWGAPQANRAAHHLTNAKNVQSQQKILQGLNGKLAELQKTKPNLRARITRQFWPRSGG